MKYKRCSSCIPGSRALTGYYQPGQLSPVLTECRQSWSRQSGKLGNVHTKSEDTVALRKFREQIKVEQGAKDGEFLLVYMVDEEDLGDNRRGLTLMVK
ncbi:hypothetical protein LAZ67_10002108 [Cordylochernes scorpioides]|uniref:Uncharacterized protein n=1 Tax=Cordylochernes scorpioides TaxID=51811 RepID=A0ABY6KWF0_9ARAC|nr:hypothetical protein LAZ67_10002108 [Cordylochernes scorpioides]